jgi:hypothetical protein
MQSRSSDGIMDCAFIFIEKVDLLLLLGGMKNGQKKDIKKTGLLLRKYAYCKE